MQGTGQGQGLAADAGAGLVGQVLTRAGDGHLDDAGGDGGQDGQQERGDGVGAAFLVIAAAAEDGGELHEVGDADDDRGQHTGDGLDQDVTVGDVADLVGDDAAQLFGAEDAHDAVGDGHHTVLGVAAGGEGVGRVFGDDTDAGLGDAGIGGKLGHHAVQHGGFVFGQLAGLVHGEHDLVRIPVGTHVHDHGDHKGDDDAGAAAHDAAQADDDGGKQGEKQHGLDLAGHGISLMCEVGIRSL